MKKKRSLESQQPNLRRSLSVAPELRMLYALGALRHADLSSTLPLLVDVFVEFALRTRDASLRAFLLVACRATRDAFWAAVDAAPAPCMGDAPRPPPAFGNRHERTAWAFARCHGCMEVADGDRRSVACLETGLMTTIVTCRACPLHPRSRLGPMTIRGGRLVVWPAAMGDVRADVAPIVHAERVAANFEVAKREATVRVVRVSRQLWSGMPSQMLDRQMRNGSATKAPTTCIDELLVVAAAPGAPQFQFRVTAEREVSTRLTSTGRSDVLLRLVAEKTRRVTIRNEFVRSVAAWIAARAVVAVPTARPRRGPALVVRLPSGLCCTHDSAGVRQLVSCSRCDAGTSV